MKRKNRAFKVVQGCVQDDFHNMSDDDLMLLAAAGQNDAFNVIVARHQPRVYSYAVRFLGDPAEGRDVTQDVFIYVWLDRHKYIPKGKFTSYLYRIKYNRCQVVARYRKRKKGREEDWFEKEGLKSTDSGELSIRTVLLTERRKLVDEALTQLNPEMRSVLILRMTEALSYEEIVERTNLPPGTVRSHVSRGLDTYTKLCHARDSNGTKMSARRGGNWRRYEGMSG